MTPALILLLAWVVQFGADTAESWGWDYFAAVAVTNGVEVAILWALLAIRLSAQHVGPSLSDRAGAWCARCACWWCAIEGCERAGCRLAFDMTVPPPRSDVNICDIATGLPMTWVSIAAAVALACLAIESTRR